MDSLVVISVVRDFAMYERCLAKNPLVANCEHIVFDNREKNETIPILYNRYLKAYDFSKPAWFMFCHEDFEPRENIQRVVSTLSKDAIWGPIGAKTVVKWWGWCKWKGVGRIVMVNKDGSEPTEEGVMSSPQEVVETLDCCCILVHSSLFARTGLLFDENLSYDLYVEDLCIAAQELHGIRSMAVSFPCAHYSKNGPGDRYEQQHRYLNMKWRNMSYSSPCSWNIGGRFGVRMVFAWVKELVRRLNRRDAR